MIHILFSLLLGSMISLLLVAPSSYYLILSLIPIIGFVLIIILKKSIPRPSKYIVISMPFVIILSYLLTSFIVFHPNNIELKINSSTLKSENKAVILYADGEMEKYIPYFAVENLKSKPLLIKPIESFKIKQGYNTIGYSEKNKEILKISNEFRSSLLNNTPNYYYLAYSSFTPSLNEAIMTSVKDKCRDITIINLSIKPESSEYISSIKSSLVQSGLSVKITTPVFDSIKMETLLDNKKIDSTNYSSVLVLTEKTDQGVKDILYKKGFKDNNIFIDPNLNTGLKSIHNASLKGKILIINLIDFNGSLYDKYTINKISKKYDDLNIDTISPYSYRKDMLEYIINEYQNAK
ncbi:MAG: hypothetical protein RR840_09780 [Clostridium sp.]